MRNKTIQRVIEKAKRNKKYSDSRYICAQISRRNLDSLSFQMGPNCNLKCSHCYGDYGPDRQGLPSYEVVKTTLEQAKGLGFTAIDLSDGEPLRDENKEVMGLIASYSSDMLLGIMTNGTFASTPEKSDSWFDFLINQGFDFSRSSLITSVGPTYNVPMKNYKNIVDSFRKLSPEILFNKRLRFSYLHSTGKIRDSISFAREFKKILNCQDAKVYNDGTHFPCFIFKLNDDFLFMDIRECDPSGRGENLEMFKNKPPRQLSVRSMGFIPDYKEVLLVSNTGDVSFGVSQDCSGAGRVCGNVMQKPLEEILEDIYNDPFYQAFKLGGVRFVYSIAKKIHTGFSLDGRIRCNACKEISRNPELTQEIRQRLSKNGVIKEYKQYLKRAGGQKNY